MHFPRDPSPDDESSAGEFFTREIDAARNGSSEALGRILEASRKFLLLIANESLDGKLKARIGASDLVQQSFDDAIRGFEGFRGSTEREWFCWLRSILCHRIQNCQRYHGAERRDIHREVRPALPHAAIWQRPDDGRTPDAAALAREEELMLRRALDQLPEETRSVIELRSLHRQPFAAIGIKLGCSEDAARKRWVAGILKLQRALKELADSTDGR